MTEIHFQSYDDSTGVVGGATFRADGDVTLADAQRLASEHAGPGLAVDLVGLVVADGTDLVARWEDEHAHQL